jgi:hypothetical protein
MSVSSAPVSFAKDPVSFANDIVPLFRSIDIDHMKPAGILLDSYPYMSSATGGHANANAVLKVLKNKTMPPGGPFWTEDQLELFTQWMSGGFQP